MLVRETDCCSRIIMTRMAPRAISLEHHMKKDPYEGRTGQVIGGGKTRTALLKKRTDPRRFASSEKFKKMTELGRPGREKYLALGQDARNSLRLVHTS